jgi:predicted porin
MKRTLLAAAVATLATGAAFAQSSVTIYGRLNESLESQKDLGTAGTKYVLQNNASRIGFKGTEDMGGGLKAGFQIEHGFSADTGAAAAPFWGRQSEVNLGGNFGLVRLGTFTSEAYFATSDMTDLINHGTGNASDALYAYLGRNKNKVAYRTPDFAGLTVEGAISLGEGVGGDPRTSDVAINYGNGPLGLGFGYEKVDGGDNQFAVRANYEAGPVLVTGYVQRYTSQAVHASQTILRLSGMYTLGGGEFHLAFGAAGKLGVANTGAKQVTLGYNYNLSKRTKVYTFYTAVKNDTNAAYGGASALGKDPAAFAVGIRHNF